MFHYNPQPMQTEHLLLTFTHQNLPQNSLTCTLNRKTHQHSLNILLHVPTDTFPKIYQKELTDITLDLQLKLIFENIGNLFKVIKEKKNIQVQNNGTIRIKFGIFMGTLQEQDIQNENQGKCRSILLKLERSLQNQLDEIRGIIAQRTQGLGDFEYLQSRIEKLWKRQQQNERIFMKFKEDIEFRVQQFSERMTIQNTKIAIIRQDINKLLLSFNKLSHILCPVFTKVNILSDHTNQFIFQDRKIMYIGQGGLWTQICLREQLNWHKKYEIGFKIVNSKKCNIIAGITLASLFTCKSSIIPHKGQKIDRKYIGLSGLGHLYTTSGDYQYAQQKNVIVLKHDPQRLEKPSQAHKQRQKQSYDQSQKKSGHQITMSSPIMTSMKSGSLQAHHSVLSSSKHGGQHPPVFKPMQIIKMCIQLEKEKILWRNGNRVIMQGKIGPEFKNESIVVNFQLCDTGDSIELIDI